MVQEGLRDPNPPLPVELRLRRAREEEPLHPAALLAHEVEARKAGLDEAVPIRARVREKTAVHAPRHHDPVSEEVPQAGRQREPVLLVEGVGVFTEEHRAAVPVSTTLPHDKPPHPTCPPLGGGTRPARDGRKSGRPCARTGSTPPS